MKFSALDFDGVNHRDDLNSLPNHKAPRETVPQLGTKLLYQDCRWRTGQVSRPGVVLELKYFWKLKN